MHEAEGFWHLLTDPAHWGIELVAEALFFGVEVLILDRLLHRHKPMTFSTLRDDST